MKLLTIKPLLLPVLSAATMLAACSSATDTAPEGTEPDAAVPAQARFSPFTGDVPLPINLFFNAQTGQAADGTLNIPSSSSPAIAASQQDGWSTIAPITINMSEAVAPATVGNAIRVFHICVDPGSKAPISPLASPYSPDVLIPGVDYQTEVSAVNDQQILVKPINPLRGKFDPTGPCIKVTSTTPHPAGGFLPAENGYIVAVTAATQTAAGESFAGSSVYQLLQNTACYYRFAPNEPSCPATGPEDDVAQAGLTPAGEAAGLAIAADASQQSTEKLRRLTNGQEALITAFSGGAINTGNLILSFSFSTQSIGSVLSAVKQIAAQTAAAIPAANNPKLFNSGISTSALGASGAGNIYVGSVTLPYYSPLPSSSTDSNILTGSWKTASGNSPYFADPVPAKTGDVTVPVFAVMPNSAANGASVPVAIVQHGITSNRTQIVALADSLAKAGVATVAIDLPLHGLNNNAAPFNQVRVPYDYSTNTGERLFDINLVANGEEEVSPCTGVAPTVDEGERDDSGIHFINLPSLLTSRDNLRQAVADLLMLEQLVPKMQWLTVNPSTGAVLAARTSNADAINFVGHSLGGIVGTTFAALSSNIKSASLLTTGGGIAKLLDTSAAFGPRIATGLAAQGAQEGTADYEQFLVFAQTLIDSADPLNYAKLIDIPIHNVVIEGGATSITVLANGTPVSVAVPASPPDLVVPNDAFNPQAVFGENTPVTGVGGSKPLYEQLGLTTVEHTRDSSSPSCTLGSVKHAVLFDSGSHSSPLTPRATYPDPTDPSARICVLELEELTEIHQQTVTFIASNGAALSIDGGCTAK